MASILSAPPAATVAVDYPSSDGKPMAESDSQLLPLLYAVYGLRHHFRNDPDVYVSGNLLLYYQEGKRSAVAPDVFVVFGVPDKVRSSYFLWEEAKGPDFVLEITSRSTWREDQTRKRELYHRLGVREYWQYDPTRDYLEPPLQGLELMGGAYRRLPERELADGTLALWSEVLGLELRLQVQLAERELRFHDPQTGKDLLDYTETDDRRREAEDGRQQAEVRAEHEAAARRAAETRVREEEAARRAAETRVRAEEAARRQAEAAREAAEARIAELEALLRRGPDTRNSQR